MSDAQENGATQGQDLQMPGLRILAQYTKDLSFENPNAPDSLRPRENLLKSTSRSTSMQRHCPRPSSKPN